MKAYLRGRKEAGTRKDCARIYKTERAEKEYWRGYIEAMQEKLQGGDMLVRCEREGTIFATKILGNYVNCPTCGRRYEYQEDGS